MTDSAAPKLRPVHRQMPFATPRVVAALILREMSMGSGRKPGGFLWVIIEPVAGIALFSFILVSVGLRTPSLGTNFAIFYATGILPYQTAMGVSARLSQVLKASRPLLSYPRVTITDVVVARFTLALLTQLLVSYLLLAGMVTVMDTGTQLLVGTIVLGFVMAAVLAAGLGMLNCFLTMRFPLWASIWGVITRPLFLASGIIFIADDLPPEWRHYLIWNPLVHVTAQVRSGFYHSYEPPYVSPAYVFGVGLTMAVVGFLFLWRTYRDLLED